MGFRLLLELAGCHGTSLRLSAGDATFPRLYLAARQHPAAVVVDLDRDGVRDVIDALENWLLDTSPAGHIAPSVQPLNSPPA